jgi:DNA-directed RNA polymerase subunit H (RpoH/RPB5)
MASKNELKKIMRSFHTITSYLENSYFEDSTIPHEEKDIPLEMFKDEQLFYSERNGEKIFIFYAIHKNSFSKKELSSLISRFFETGDNPIEKEDHVIIIVNDYTMDSIRDLLKNDYSHYYIQISTLDQLQYNILEHSFVPKHIKLNPSEKKELFQKYNITKDKQLPQISQFDPVARAIFLRPGQVCKIIRYDKISLENEYYRVCVP